MNILVVDDEYYIVKNIIENTDWNSLGITKQFAAYSAIQAKKILESSEDIDILLTDIEMPRESGLDLIAWVNDNKFYATILVLTGHQRFDYAQKALNMHIFSYVLKPIDIQSLETELASAVRNVRKNQLYRKEIMSIEEQLANIPANFVTSVKTCVREHLASPELDRNMIANEIHMNPDYMSHQFHKKAGVRLSNYILEERMRTARKLLVTTNYSVQQICDKTGFSNISYFHRQFKKLYGITPQKYRSQHQ